jgi:hypothetical protein
MPKFKKGDKLVCIKSWGMGGIHITEGKEYVALADSCVRGFVEVPRDGSGERGGYYAECFKLAEKAVPQFEQTVGKSFEVRWSALKTAPNPLPDRTLTRRPLTQKEAEDFIERNGDKYAAGTFDIVEIVMIRREKVLRKVRRVTKTVHELVDA